MPESQPAPQPGELHTAATPFVGRERELAVLGAAFEQVLAGRRQVVLLVGEPGIGKTRTAEAFTTLARERGALVLWGSCYEWDGAPPYRPWRQAMRAWLHDSDPGAARAALGRGAADIAQIVPEVAEVVPSLPPVPHLEPEQARFRLFESITAVLRNLARTQPLVLIFDDLHWADAPSLLLLEFVARELRASPLLLLGTYRHAEVSRQHPLAATLAELAREPSSLRVMVRGLSHAEVGRYLTLATGVEPLPALVVAVERGTEGNPFFVTEVVRWLQAEGQLAPDGNTRGITLGLPESVREVIGRRLDRLSATCNQILPLAAVAGREFDVALLAPVCSLPPDTLIEALEEALRAGIVEDASGLGRFRFRHALIQETLYQELRTPQRVRLHQQLGEALERLHAGHLDAYYDELAHHFFQAASAGSLDKAIAYAVTAAERATAQLAWESSVEHVQRALQLLDLQQPPDEHLRCGLLLALGAARWKSGATEPGRAAYQQAATLARQLHAPTLLARAALGYTGADVVGQVFFGDATAVQLLEEALAALPTDDSILRIKLLAHLGIILSVVSGDDAPHWLERRRTLTHAAVAMARRVGDLPTLLYSLILHWHGLNGLETLAERHAVAEELIQRATAAGDGYSAMFGHGACAVDWLDQGDIPGFEHELTLYADLAAATQLPIWTANVLSYRAMLALLKGRFDEVEPLVHAWQELNGGVSPDAPLEDAMQHLFILRREQGRLAEMAAIVPRVDGMNRREEAHWRCQEGLMLWELGQPGRAQALFASLAARNYEGMARDWWWLPNIALLGELCAVLGDVQHATRLYDLLQPYAHRHVSVGNRRRCFGSTAYYLGRLATVLERWNAAEQHFEAAQAMHARMGARPFVAHTQHAWADMLVRRGQPGDVQRASDLAQRALATTDDLGMTRLAERLHVLLTTISATSSTTATAKASVAGLSPRELDVLRLLVEGRSDREIAAALFISHRTVMTHVVNILNKLGVSSRTAAASLAVRDGIV
jgi:DNA-binding CsgD family transcriptional regulator